jgi:hypothetical protein
MVPVHPLAIQLALAPFVLFIVIVAIFVFLKNRKP